MKVKTFVSLLILPAFCLLTFSCVTTKSKPGSELGQTNPKAAIVSLVTKSGQVMDFRKDNPARIVPGSDTIVGKTLQHFEVARQDVKSTGKNGQGQTVQVVMTSGKAYEVVSYSEKDDKAYYAAYVPTTIPVADVQQVWIRKTDTGRTILLTAGLVAVSFAIAYVLSTVLLVHEVDSHSCPFVYSWNGEEYVLDAEPYGAAISEGLKRTDWIELSELREVGGRYRILLANELDETQYTDELKLVAVDHAPGQKIAPDLAGGFHAFSNPVSPARAFDQNGRDILAFVAKNDRAFWLSPLGEKDPGGEGEFRDDLIFEFPKPPFAKQARLLANAWTTSWGSRSAGLFLEHYGAALPEKYAEVDAHGPMYSRLVSWMTTEELAALKVWVETPAGWKARALIMGGAPVITKDRACLLDVGDIPGETLRVRLRPPVNFWMVNSLAVDYGEEAAVRVTEIAAERAVDHTGRDARAILASTDRSYLESAGRGEQTELVFQAPPKAEKLERTVFVKASGYYRIHIEATGEPRAELTERILGEPGFAARYSFREYLKWEAGLRARLAGAGR